MDNQTLSKIISELQEKACVTPLSVSRTKSYSNESPQDIYAIQEKFLTLPENIKDKLVSQETSRVIREVGKVYNLQLLQLADISRAIRSYYFGEIHLEDFPSILYKEMGVDLNTAKEISQIVIQKIINDDSQEKAYQANLEKVSLPDALTRYPTVADQLITSAQIRIRGGQESVRPTIKNWLADYTYSVGYDAHSSIVRGNYLFQNENTKVLSNDDRQKLTYILKSYDEKTPVTVDATRKQIVFPTINGEGYNPAPAKQEAVSNGRQASQFYSSAESLRLNEIKTNDSDEKQVSNVRVPHFDLRQSSETLTKKSQPVYNMDNIQPAGLPAKPQYAPPKPAPQKNLEQNYEHYHITQKPAFDSAPLAQAENLKFSSPQKLPFEKEKEKMFSAPAPVAPPIPTAPPISTKPLIPQLPPKTSAPQAPPLQPAPEKMPAPIAPEPLRIHPASSHDEDDEKEQLPRNVVNLKDNF